MQKNVSIKDIFYAIECIAVGSLFGIFIHKSRVFNPKHIMVKMFMSAVGSGLLVFSLISYFDPERFAKSQSGKRNLIHRGLVGPLVGGMILGIGLALAGACPGIVYIQIGSFVPMALVVLLGCFVGGFVFGCVSDSVDSIILPSTPCTIPGTLNDYLKMPYYKVAPIVSIFVWLIIFLIEYLHPWTVDLDIGLNQKSSNWLRHTAWMPEIAGACIGLLQFPVLYVCGGGSIGSANQYITLLAQIYDKTQHFRNAKNGWGNWWQFFFIFGSSIGSFISNELSLAKADISSPVGYVSAFIGGFCLLFGARMARGCTSGNGISGLSLLSTVGLVCCCGMFGGAIATAMLLKSYHLFGY